jgi:hypothetical protein
MDPTANSFTKPLLRGLSKVVFVIAGFAFLVGGRAISEFGKVDRILAEMLGIMFALVCAGLGMFLKSAGEPDENDLPR